VRTALVTLTKWGLKQHY